MLPHEGNGRPVKYHKDARWPGGKTCEQMAAAARKAAQDAGVGTLVNLLDERADTLLDGLGPLSDDLAEVLDALRDLRTGLRDEVTEADRARTAA